ncbi:MAG TPA: VWA domain-containing protein [Lacipirellulaceae bacterium]|nr:VWA domain-containing protein [Lacipirellulaceae bacterium]
MLVFNNPWYLLLLVLLPAMWWFSFGSLSGLGRWRRLMALALRSLVFLLIVAALAEMQYQRTSDKLTVIYLLDESLSIPEARRDAMISYVNASMREQRNADKNDRAGVIVFGRNAEVEVPPIDFTIQLGRRIESLLDREYTNLAGAMQRAMSMFPHDTAKRIVLVTDGNQNIGDALAEARSVADAGVSIDVLPVPLERRSDVAVEKIAMPPDVRRNQPFEVRVVVNNATDSNGAGHPIKGHMRIVRKAGDREETLVDEPTEIKPGKSVFPFRQTIDQSDFYTYEARFIPDDPAADAISQNNEATAFTHVQGKGLVLLIENWETPGEFDHLVERLRHEGLEVVVQPSNRLFTSLPELQRYDTVILADVPRASGEDTANVSSFSDDQIKMLVRNTEELGCGLIMLGGPNSFGAGGWANTELEKAMPVDFQIKSAKVVPVGALVLNMHASEIPQANYWQKVIAQEAIKALGPRDYCGLVYFGNSDQWLWGQTDPQHAGMLHVGPNRNMMLAKIDKMSIGDMPNFDPSMKKAAIGLAGCTDAATKLMILASDGDPGAPSQSTINALKQGGVTVTTVAVGAHGPAGSATLQNIALATGGKYYIVNNAKALPKIYQREARRVARPLVYEPQTPVSPQITSQHEIVRGLENAFPPIRGFVLTTVKENSLVDVILRSPLPSEPENSTILATWTYGLGKAVAFTTDAGQRWTTAWTSWDQYDRFFSQMVRWSMRPTGDTGKYTVATDVEGNKTRVIVSALNKEDEFLNYQTMDGNVLTPDMKSIGLQMEQTAPGRYVGEFESGKPGSYLISIRTANAMIRTGVNVGYSNEFRDRETNTPLLKSIADSPAKRGEAGKLMPPLPDVPADVEKADELLKPQLAIDPYRRDLPQAVSRQDIWPSLILAASCMFFADVFVRRVQVNFGWLVPIWLRLADIVLGRERQAAAPETMARLRSRKAEIDRSIESRRATARFEPDAALPVDPKAIEAAETRPTATGAPAPRPAKPVAEPEAEDTYTSRLLKAKKQVWKDRSQDRGFDPDAKDDK